MAHSDLMDFFSGLLGVEAPPAEPVTAPAAPESEPAPLSPPPAAEPVVEPTAPAIHAAPVPAPEPAEPYERPASMRGKTIWDRLTSSQRRRWMAEHPEQASASRDGQDPEPVSLGRVDSHARPRTPDRALPAGLSQLDTDALRFWFRLTRAEQQRSTMRPDRQLVKLARLEGRAA